MASKKKHLTTILTDLRRLGLKANRLMKSQELRVATNTTWLTKLRSYFCVELVEVILESLGLIDDGIIPIALLVLKMLVKKVAAYFKRKSKL